MTSTETPRRKSLREFRETANTLFAKNTTPHKITCNTDKIAFELEPAGADDSIRILPKECLDVPGFQRLWMKKHVVISDDEAMENEITLLMGGRVELPLPVDVMKDDGTIEKVTPSITEKSDIRDIVIKTDDAGQPISTKCILGGEPVFQTQVQINEGQPPLCAEHMPESARIASIQQSDGTWVHRVPTVEK